MEKRGFFYYGKFAFFGVAGMILFSFVVMWLWNWLVPELFHGPVVTYWQMVGLFILSKILFSGVGGRGHGCRYPHHYGRRSDYSREWAGSHRDKWRKRYEEKMNGKVEGDHDHGSGDKAGDMSGHKGDDSDVIITD